MTYELFKTYKCYDNCKKNKVKFKLSRFKLLQLDCIYSLIVILKIILLYCKNACK